MPVTYQMASGRTGAALSRTPPASAPCFVANVPIVASRVDVAFLRIKCDGKKKVSRSSIHSDAVSNVAVIIVRIVFISLFLFYCLLLNHSFQTNPNKITNCFKLILSLLQLYKIHCSCVAILIFEQCWFK